MHNPFSEVTGDELEDAELVRQSNDGDRDALERLILRHQAWIFNIAVRMVFHPQDAEEVTQEVLVKARDWYDSLAYQEAAQHRFRGQSIVD